MKISLSLLMNQYRWCVETLIRQMGAVGKTVTMSLFDVYRGEKLAQEKVTGYSLVSIDKQ
jgi:hypothetical protein